MKMSDIISCSSKDSSLLKEYKISDIFICSSKESSLLEQVMMSDIFISNFTGEGRICLLLFCHATHHLGGWSFFNFFFGGGYFLVDFFNFRNIFFIY